MNEMQRYATGAETPTRTNRMAAREAKDIRHEVQLAGMKADGSMALAAHIMDGAVELDAVRRELSQGDPSLDLILSQIEATALRQASTIQRRLFNDWGL